MADTDEREEELETIRAIYPELAINKHDKFTASLDIAVSPSKPLYIRFKPLTTEEANGAATYAETAKAAAAYIEHDVQFSHLPSLKLTVTLPQQYPAEAPPTVRLASQQRWLPQSKLAELEQDASVLWEDYGRCQILFAYIDHLQQAAERGFDLDQLETGCLVLPAKAEAALTDFDAATALSLFNAGTYDCGICLEPKRGSSCFKLAKCGHIFCKQCLQDFYNNAITEGDVAGVRCLSPDCGKEEENGRKRKRRNERTLHPRDLFAIGIEEGIVRRYVEMKRKKRLEADKTTVYCPRTWCQGPARSPKYPPIPKDLASYDMAESSSDEEDDASASTQLKARDHASIPPDPSDRLAVCEKCQLAFCRVCFMGWHGPFARCFPRDPNELSAEEKASYDYIRMHTSPCPTCSSPTQKTMGCNHMRCFQCNTHFCYLCGAWLDGQNPYQHFNKAGTECFQRLWELEEGDEGQRPADGRGFAGGRRWEQMALEAAREAEEREAREAQVREDAAAAAQLAGQDAEDARRGQPRMLDDLDAPGEPIEFGDIPPQPHMPNGPNAPAEPAEVEGLAQGLFEQAMAELRLRDRPAVEQQQQQQQQQDPQQQPRRRQRNPFPQRPPAPAAHGQAIRQHERNRPRPARGAANANIHRRLRRGEELEQEFDEGEDEGGPYVVLNVGAPGHQRRMRIHHDHPLF